MPFQITRKVRIVAISLLLLLVAYTAFGFWLVPKIVRGNLEDFSAQHWQRKPTVGDISFNPFTLALEVRKFDFKDSTGAALLSFDRLFVNLDISSLWRRGISFHEIELDQPAGRAVVRADGSFNLAELAKPFATPPGTTPEPGEPTRVFIDRLQLAGGVFEFEDHARARPFKARLTPVNFELRDFSTTGKTGNNYNLQATSVAGEKFRWSGSFALTPLSSRGQFELTDVQARTLWSYLQESLGFEVSNGMVGVSGGYVFAATEPQLTFEVNFTHVNVGGLKLRPRGGDTDWVMLNKLALNDTRIDISKRTVRIASVELNDGTVLAQRGADGAVNLLSLMEVPREAAVEPAAVPAPSPEPAPARSPAPAPTTESAWTVSVPEIGVNALRVEFKDEFVKPTAAFAFSPVNLQVRGYSTAPGQVLDLDANLTIENGGGLVLQGKGIPADQSFTGKIKLDGLNLAAFQPYIGTYSQMTLLSGLLDADLDADLKPDDLRITGDLISTKVHTVDNALREDFIKWDRLALNGVDYRSPASQPGSLRINGIIARAPYIRFIIAPDESTNIGKVLTQPASAPGPVQTVQGVSDNPTGTQQPMAMSIGKVQVENGSANFADFWIKPNYAVSIQQLAGTITGLSSQKSSRAKIALNGKLDRYAPVGINGELNLLSATLFTDIHVKFDGVELTSVTPYSGRFAGYRIEKGKLSVDVRYKVEDRKLNAEQRFVIDQLTLGERVESPDAVHLPLKIAVALLKDRNGVIDIGLPLTGSLDDPKFRLGPIIWKAFVNLLTGIATSPFKLLGSMFGGGEEVNLIDFEPGNATLDAAAKEKLAALTKALRERPQLSLEVPAAYSPDADFALLAARDLEARLQALPAARKGGDAATPEDPAHRFELLTALYRAEKSGAALPPGAQALQAVRAKDRDAAAMVTANGELEAALRASIDSLEAPLLALATERARAIQDALLSSGEIEPGRVFMLAASAQPASGEKVRVALSLK